MYTELYMLSNCSLLIIIEIAISSMQLHSYYVYSYINLKIGTTLELYGY